MSWLKYYLIIMIGLITDKTVVNFLGSSYAISRNTVRKLGDTK